MKFSKDSKYTEFLFPEKLGVWRFVERNLAYADNSRSKINRYENMGNYPYNENRRNETIHIQ